MIPSPMHWRPGENLKMRKPKLPQIAKIHLKHHHFCDIFWHLLFIFGGCRWEIRNMFLFSSRLWREDEAILAHIVSTEKDSTVASQGFCCGYE